MSSKNSTSLLTTDWGGWTLLAIKIEASTAGRQWGEKKTIQRRKSPGVHPLLCDPGWF